MEEKITIKQASKLTGMPEQFIRLGLQQNKIPFGIAVMNKKEFSYYISKTQLEEYLKRKITREELEELI